MLLPNKSSCNSTLKLYGFKLALVTVSLLYCIASQMGSGKWHYMIKKGRGGGKCGYQVLQMND